MPSDQNYPTAEPRVLDHYLVGVVIQQIDVFSCWAHTPEEAAQKIQTQRKECNHRWTEDPTEVGLVLKVIPLGQDMSGFRFTQMLAQVPRPVPEKKIIVPDLVPPPDISGGGENR